MDKKAIKNFAIESRKKLITEIKYKMGLLGITSEDIVDPVKKAEGMEVYDIGAATPHTIYDEAIEQRKSLVKRIKERGYDNVVEEVAYTWFNRIIAIRFMEVNDYLPTRVRVLSSENPIKTEPDIVTEAPNIDLDFTDAEIEQIYKLKTDNKLDELFRLLFIKQCNKLNEILPELFEKTADYTELLLSISFTNEDGVVRQVIDSINEEDFKEEVEIIGWLYQYYNTELKEKTFKELKKGVKVSKEKIPAVTQLFTPDWIVRYMVENSLGRLWLEGHPASELKKNWKYYLDEAKQEPEVQIELAKIREESKNLKPEDIKIIDPAMGSGHILVYAFDVLMQIYTSVGYSEKDATESILKNNLYGLDIDDRAYQLAYFAVMMKARSYNRQILTKNIEPQICAIQESNEITDELIDFMADGDPNIRKDLRYLVETSKDAKEYGSIIDINKKIDYLKLEKSLDNVKKTKKPNLQSLTYQREASSFIKPLLKQSKLLAIKYHAVITNPPYMGSNGMNKKLKKYLKENFPNTKSDLSTVFMEKTLEFCKKRGYISMINIPVWMFLSTYKKLRKDIIISKTFINMLHLGRGIFGSDFGTTSFVISNCHIKDYIATYRQLYEKKGAVDSVEQKRIWFFEKSENKFEIKQESFSRIPGNPVAYWIEEDSINLFSNNNNIYFYATVNEGLKTADNERFIRKWFEVQIGKTNITNSNNFKWVKHTKGGEYRKWYGNNEDVLNFENNGFELKNFKKASLSGEENYFKENVTWSRITSSKTSFRFTPEGSIPNMAGLALYSSNPEYFLAYLNSKISYLILNIINPTLNFPPGTIGNVPINFSEKYETTIKKLSAENIQIARDDWDSFEISWDFKTHPFINIITKKDLMSIEKSFKCWRDITKKRFYQTKNNEEKINSIFIEIDKLSKVTPEISESDITIIKAELNRDIKSFISYAVGCMLGRYSLDNEGLIYAGGQWDPSKYCKFLPDEDNIIPILDTEYFEDDIVGRFVEFVKVTFGEETLEENLDFIASALKKRGNTSREVIRNYFLTDFYKDHVKTYKKRPIYWQFDSGKNNGFKALIYMHRYEPDLVARVRTDYLHKTQKAIETAINQNERIIKNSNSASEKSKAVKAKNKLVKQLEETRKYDEALAHIANQKIEIDLDDGVKVNYAKFQGVEVSKEGKKSKKIDLLKKI